MKNKTKLKVAWGESLVADSTAFNPSANYSRQGFAYLSDCTFTFNDRENSTKSIQFTGASELQAVSSGGESGEISADAYTKGQNVRLFVSSDNEALPTSVIAAAKSLSLHVSLQMESATTKDTTGNYDIQEPTALSYDISSNALVRSADTIESQVGGNSLSDIAAIYEAGTPVLWKIANTSGANNRTAGAAIVSGSVVITSLELQGPNRQTAQYQATLQGYGPYLVSA
jgi:predicted secreted protein